MSNNNEKIAHIYPLTLNVLSPVSISTGETLSGFIDFLFFRENKELSFVDKDIFEKIIAEKDLIDELVDSTINLKKKKTGESIPFNIKYFLNDYHIPTDTVLKKPFLIVKGDDRTNVSEIYPIIKNAGKPYIAGSSIKGAINTVILYDWLISSNEGKEYLNQFISFLKVQFNSFSEDILTSFQERKDIFVEKEEYKGEREKARRRNDESERKRLSGKVKSANKTIDNINKELLKKLDLNIKAIESKFDQIIQKLFGNTADENSRMPMSLLQVSDSDLIDNENIVIYDTKRFHLIDNKSTISQVRETIEQGTQTHIRFVIDTLKREINHPYLKTILASENPIRNLFTKINQFALANLEYELSEIKNKGTERSKYRQFISEQKSKIEGSQNSAFLRVGSGKTYFWNSIGLAIYNKDEEIFTKLREIFELYPMRTEGFPITVAMTMDKFLPLGWIKLSIDTKNESQNSSTSEITTQNQSDNDIKENSKKDIDYLKGKIKQGAELQAEVVKSGKPNKVKLFLSETEQPEVDLVGTNNPLEVGKMLLVKMNVQGAKGKEKVRDVSLVKPL